MASEKFLKRRGKEQYPKEGAVNRIYCTPNFTTTANQRMGEYMSFRRDRRPTAPK